MNKLKKKKKGLEAWYTDTEAVPTQSLSVAEPGLFSCSWTTHWLIIDIINYTVRLNDSFTDATGWPRGRRAKRRNGPYHPQVEFRQMNKRLQSNVIGAMVMGRHRVTWSHEASVRQAWGVWRAEGLPWETMSQGQ